MQYSSYCYGKWKYKDEPFYIVRRICVNPTFQNKGIAKSTLLYIEKQLTEMGIHVILLDYSPIILNRDILFNVDNFLFSFRVGGILLHDNKILLQKPEDDDYAIIGGHISGLGTTSEALIREYKEELHTDIEVGNLLAVGEIFFSLRTGLIGI